MELFGAAALERLGVRARALGWRLQVVEIGAGDGRHKIGAQRADGRTLTLIGTGCQSTVHREQSGHRRGPRVGSGNWRPIRVNMSHLGWDSGDHREMLDLFLGYMTDNAAAPLIEHVKSAQVESD